MILKTKRLQLRDPIRTDIAALSQYHQDPRYLEHYDTKSDTTAIVEQAIDWANEAPRRNFQLIAETSSNVIGCVGLRTAFCRMGESEVGLEFHPDYWGNGFAQEALLAIIEFACSKNIHTIRAETKPTNLRAIRLMESASFRVQEETMNVVIMCLKTDLLTYDNSTREEFR